MRKITKIISVAGVLLSVLCAVASAADAPATAELSKATIYVEDQIVAFQNEAGAPVYPLQYNDSTYIPVRSASEWMGKNIAWDGTQKTVSIEGTANKIYRPQIVASKEQLDELASLSKQPLPITVSSDVTIKIDGQAQAFQNQRGEPVYPITYQNVTYLPLRNISELTGLEVQWYNTNGEKIFIRTPLSADTVTRIRAFLSNAHAIDEKMQAYSQKLFMTDDTAVLKEQVQALSALTAQMEALQFPTCTLYANSEKRFQTELNLTKTELENTLAMLNAGKTVKEVNDALWVEREDSHNGTVIIYGGYTHGVLSHMSLMLDHT